MELAGIDVVRAERTGKFPLADIDETRKFEPGLHRRGDGILTSAKCWSARFSRIHTPMSIDEL